jgi:hypothetical protein
MEPEPNYGNWIRIRILVILGVCCLGIGVLCFLPLGLVYRLLMIVLLGLTLISFLYPLYAYYTFDQRGGRFQKKVYDLLICSLGERVNG